jgi:hypothetical protein
LKILLKIINSKKNINFGFFSLNAARYSEKLQAFSIVFFSGVRGLLSKLPKLAKEKILNSAFFNFE